MSAQRTPASGTRPGLQIRRPSGPQNRKASWPGFQWDSRGWLLPYTDLELLHPEDLVWPVGINNLPMHYTAGYATVPERIQAHDEERLGGLGQA